MERLPKRLFDLVWATLGLLLLWPLLIAIAVAIKLTDRGPVLFLQERIGLRGKPFSIWKFRSMVTDAEARGKQLTVGEDSRITPIGRWLRKLKLDELPQLVNVLRGQMSFVGPRPEVRRYVDLYDEEQRRVLELVPGITDPASIHYRNESDILAQSADPERTYIERVMPDKIRINLEYAATASLWSDLKIMAQTVLSLGR